jgi:two-component system sensor histidine kinase QseC
MGRPSLRRRLVALLLAAVGCAWIAIGALTAADARREIDAVLDAQLSQAATLVATRARHDLDDSESESESESEDAGRDDGHPYATQVTFQIWTADRQLLRRSAGAPASPLTRVTDGFDDPVIDGRAWRTFSLSNHGLLVTVAEGRDRRDQLAMRFVQHTLWPLFAAIPLFGLLVWITVTRALRPLVLLSDDLRGRRASDLGPVAVSHIPDEVAPLVAQLDELFARIRDRLDSERRFTSDAAHELRTPIAGIRAQAESALSAADAGERAAALNRVVAACDRLSRVVSQLLTLARMEEMPLDEHVTCRLDEVAREVVADIAPQALALGIDLGVSAAGEAAARAEPLLAQVLVRNLVDNAVRYAGRGARIDVRVAREDGRTVLVVADDGPGVPAGDLDRLGQPFFRSDQPSGTGTGLGLSIVARIAERYGGVVQYLPGLNDRGLSVRVSLPR